MMSAWGNIEISPDDQEIASLERIEHALGDLPEDIGKVRALISRFEICHFKYQQHYRHLIRSIAALKSEVDIDNIGKTHPRNGKRAVKLDTTGRSMMGQLYITALHTWLEQINAKPNAAQKKMNGQISLWLGNRDDEKTKLVIMLLDRLMYRLDGYDYQNMTGLEYQIMRTDICCQGFPINMDRMIQSIGKLTPVANFIGCGIPNTDAMQTASEWLNELKLWLKDGSGSISARLGSINPEKLWLTACLFKTIKEQIHSSEPIPVSISEVPKRKL